MSKKGFVCSICGECIIGEYGNNPQPITSGECCDWCNRAYVIPARIYGVDAVLPYIEEELKEA